jgi:hypothetical protein
MGVIISDAQPRTWDLFAETPVSFVQPEITVAVLLYIYWAHEKYNGRREIREKEGRKENNFQGR